MDHVGHGNRSDAQEVKLVVSCLALYVCCARTSLILSISCTHNFICFFFHTIFAS